ncbi:transposase family protein [Micromonospora globispora]|uniref:transposase family protein n=1 Tax=Micromonospora globispora TaxID=1450148 RepID=UPI001A9C2A0B|nr:transposase family protein [Micromonospora globispora]
MFTDRLLVTLVHLRHQLPHAALAELYGVDRSTVSAAIREVRPLLTARGFAVPDRPGPRLRALEDLFAYADVEGVDLRIDGTEVQVRRPRAGRPGRKAFVSGRKKQNTIKTTTFSDRQGRTLFSGVIRPGRMHDQTAARTEGIAEHFRHCPKVKAEVDEGYWGLANEFPSQVTAPPGKPKKDASLGDHHNRRETRRRQSSRRICVEHTSAEYKQWHPLQRYTGRRETYAKPTWRSPGWSPTDPPFGPHATPNWCSPGKPPADQPSAEAQADMPRPQSLPPIRYVQCLSTSRTSETDPLRSRPQSSGRLRERTGSRRPAAGRGCTSASRLPVSWWYDRSPARLGRGDRWGRSHRGCPP